ncbi:hypothetical protein ACFY00_37925, partial [Kitasatospora sp. NPDC001540]|uniref:hypothetical protein n=1 Tax=Kitasatospora sp. NPDC001540 TaxID=3364014 RepID=UPI0036BFB2F4
DPRPIPPLPRNESGPTAHTAGPEPNIFIRLLDVVVPAPALCPGCDKPLPPRAATGRPIAYHDSTCRSRAWRRRAREEEQATANDCLLARAAFDTLAARITEQASHLAEALHALRRPGGPAAADLDSARQALREAVDALLDHADRQAAEVCNETPDSPLVGTSAAAEATPAAAEPADPKFHDGNETPTEPALVAPAPGVLSR